jgi:CubicO group peptidase (beta-lactamase class C family)
MRRLISILVSVSALAAPIAPHSLAVAQRPAAITAARDPLQGFDAYVQQAMRDWQGAGLAIAVVKDDSVVFAKGYGVREAGKTDPVTARTLFAIGSNTKLFTAVAAGMMVDDGKMKWDAPITTYLPWFQLYDPYVSREITVRDMLSHRSGLGRRGDAIWYGTPFDRREILRRIRFLPPNSSFRSQYGYQNIMVMGAGEAVGVAAGTSWDDVIAKRVFQPLGMTASNTSIKAFRSGDDIASPHDWTDGHARPIPWRDIDNIAPAGSINSNVTDMAQWLRMLLANGGYGGKQLIKPGTLREIESAQTITGSPNDSLRPSIHFAAYGLGVGMNDYMGVKVMTHTGGIDGMLSQVTWIPERKLGVVILTNTGGHNNLFGALANRVVDAYLGAPARDWSKIYLAQVTKQEADAKAAIDRAMAARAANTKPSLTLDKYAGTYVSELYPDVVVANADGGLTAQFGKAFNGKLEHWQYDTFRFAATLLGGDGALLTFTLDARGNVAKLDLQGVGEFTKRTGDRQTASQP